MSASIDVLFHKARERGIVVPHPQSTKFDDNDAGNDAAAQASDQPRPVKKLRRSISEDSIASVASEDENALSASFDTATQDGGPAESALPEIKTDKQAIDEYEASKHLEFSSQDSTGALEQSGRSSIYVDAFNLALNTVEEEEPRLFSLKEREVFAAWRRLDYESQYLYVRLFLRKTSAWHRVCRLGYHSDIGNMERTVARLQQWFDLPTEAEESEYKPLAETALHEKVRFADCSDEDLETLKEASSLLSLDELKAFSKDAKVSGKNKSELLSAFRRNSREQRGLSWGGIGLLRTESTESDGDGAETPTSEGDNDNRESHFLEKIMAVTGPCVRLSRRTTALFERVHLVFFRSTEWTEKSLVISILARIQRRVFFPYIVYRINNIFPSRTALLEFEESIRLQAKMDDLLEGPYKQTEQLIKEILAIFEGVEERWKVIIIEEEDKEARGIYDLGEGTYMRRFSAGWVYTRMGSKATYCLGRLHLYEREHDLLVRLLKQEMFHPARRGGWYSRKALIEERYLVGCGEKAGWQRALATCEAGLRDRNTHVIFHDEIQRRVTKLEKKLRMAFGKRSIFSHVALKKPTEVTIYGHQILPRQGDTAPLRTAWKVDLLDEETITVEEYTLHHYALQGFKGRHSESRIMGFLFAILMHEVIFLPLPGVFQTAFQAAPLDFGTDTFYASRLGEIEKLLSKIEGDHPHTALEIVNTFQDAHRETSTTVRGLAWDLFDRAELEEMIRCWKGSALVAVLRHLAQGGGASGGVPDLFLWRSPNAEANDNKEESEQGEGEVRFVEVKSKNDRLSETQKVWLHVLSSAGVAVEVAHVLNVADKPA